MLLIQRKKTIETNKELKKNIYIYFYHYIMHV